MRYFTIAREADVVMWDDENGRSGILHAGDNEPVVPGAPVWADYEAWCLLGNVPQPFGATGLPSLEDARAAAIVRLHAAADLALEPILAQYPRTEVVTWSEQAIEAAAWVKDPSVSTPLLDAITAGGDKADICAGVLAKADAYKRASGAVIAWRRAATEWIEACDEQKVLADWKPSFPEIPR